MENVDRGMGSRHSVKRIMITGSSELNSTRRFKGNRQFPDENVIKTEERQKRNAKCKALIIARVADSFEFCKIC